MRLKFQIVFACAAAVFLALCLAQAAFTLSAWIWFGAVPAALLAAYWCVDGYRDWPR